MLVKSFRRRLFEFSFGTVVAQAFSLALMPVVSRLYSPDEMGDFAIYVSLSTILSIAANLRLDVPIVIAKSEREALGLLALGQLSALGVSAILYFILMALLKFGGVQIFSPAICFLVALSTYATASIESFANFFNRHQWYQKLALRNAGERFLVLAVSIGLGWLGARHLGLVLAQTLGLSASVIFFYATSRIQWPKFSRTELGAIFRTYADFPRKNILSMLLNVSSVYGAPLLFACFFTKGELGTLNLATRVFDAPVWLFGTTFRSIYYRHVVDLAPDTRQTLFRRSLKMLFAGGIIPALIIGFYGEPIFSYAFGTQWQLSGRLAFWLAPFTLLRLAFVSQMGLLLVHRRLTLDLTINSAQVVAQVLGFVVGYLCFHTVEMAVAGICIAGGLIHLLSLALIHGMLKRETENSSQDVSFANTASV